MFGVRCFCSNEISHSLLLKCHQALAVLTCSIPLPKMYTRRCAQLLWGSHINQNVSGRCNFCSRVPLVSEFAFMYNFCDAKRSISNLFLVGDFYIGECVLEEVKCRK